MPPRGKCVQLHNMYVGDFETCDGWEPVDDDDIPDQRVWLAGLMDLEEMRMVYYTNLDDWMQEILSRGNNSNKEIAFHNLKFDGSYIVPWLMHHGWIVADRQPKKGEFSVLIDERNNWYNITIQVTTKRKVTIWDSLKLFPSQLMYLPDLYGTPTRKIDEGPEFYEKRRGEDHEPTPDELAYLMNDLKVLAETLQEHIKLYGLRFKKTQASQSFKHFEDHFPCWKMRFPPLDNQTDDVLRPAYWGGVSYVNTKYQERDCHDVGVYDINSSYPYQLATKKLPYGKMLFERGPGKNPVMSKFWVASVMCRFKIKKDKIPCIPKKAIMVNRPYTNAKWLHDSSGVVVMTINCIDYLTIHESYDFEVIEWEWSKHWAWKVHKEVKGFVERNNEIKVTAKKAAKRTKCPERRRELLVESLRAKIDNNSFYGKFGEDIIKYGATPELTLEGSVMYRKDRKDEQTPFRRKFLPVAIAVTAWGRRQLVQMANLLGEHFIYCDTDSVHFFREGGDEIIEESRHGNRVIVDSTRLGAWDHEADYPFGRYLRAKCYMEGDLKEGKYDVTLSGLPADKGTGQASKVRTCINPENFHIGAVIKGGNGKLRVIRTKTGNKLVPTDFRIKEVETLF